MALIVVGEVDLSRRPRRSSRLSRVRFVEAVAEAANGEMDLE